MFTIVHLPNDKNLYICLIFLLFYHLYQVYSTHTEKLVFEIIDLTIIVCFLNIVRNIDINVKSLYYLRSNNRFQWWESILPSKQ